MKVYKSLDDIKPTDKPVVLTIGTFDGLHKGHQKLFDHVIDIANFEGSEAWVFTFSNLPFEVFNPETRHNRLLNIGCKLNLLSKKGMDAVILIDFTENFGKLNAIDFCRSLRRKFLNLKIVVGYDFKMGSGKSMDALSLKEKGERKGFDVEIMPPFMENGQKVSSTWIRSLIREGNIEKANYLLGRPYFIEGNVEPRQGKGTEIGFPTANIRNEKMVYPKDGVYLTGVRFAGSEKNEFGYKIFNSKLYYGMTFAGSNTLSSNQPPAIETNIFNYEDNLYDKKMRVYFYKFIRDKIDFDNFNELKEQLVLDKKECLSQLKKSEEIDVNQ